MLQLVSGVVAVSWHTVQHVVDLVKQVLANLNCQINKLRWVDSWVVGKAVESQHLSGIESVSVPVGT